MITYLDRTLKEEQNNINFKNQIILLNWCLLKAIKFKFYQFYQYRQ